VVLVCCTHCAEDNSLNFAAILDTAADVARAMLHLHKNQVRGMGMVCNSSIYLAKQGTGQYDDHVEHSKPHYK